MLAFWGEAKLIIEDSETASGNHRSDIAPAETQGRVRSENRIGEKVRPVAIGVNRVLGQEMRIVARDRERQDFKNPHPGPDNAAVETSQKSGRVAHLRPVPKSRLLHRPVNFSHAGKFSEIVDA